MEEAERAEHGYACLLARSERSLPARIGEPGSGSSQVDFQTAPAGVSVGWKRPDLVIFLLRELLLGQQFMRGAALSSAQNSEPKAACLKRRATSDSKLERVEK